MIIQELCRYYQRLANNPEIAISPPGFSREKIHAAIVLDKEGNLVRFDDLRVEKGKKLVPQEKIVPQSVKRTANPVPNFLWDNTSYALGADNKAKPQKAIECFNLFKEFHNKMLAGICDSDVAAFLNFINKWDPQKAVDLEHWQELAGGNVVFQIDGERQYLHEKPVFRQCWLEWKNQQTAENKGVCLATGSLQPIARLHPAIKGVQGAQSSGAALIAFNLEAFCSYNKEQNFNAPIGENAAFAYTTALNFLLSSDSKQKIQIGDATTVFWTERDSPIEGMFSMMVDPRDLEASDNAELRENLKMIRDGKMLKKINPDVKFYILGLSPNAARLAVRFWHVCSVGQLEEKIGQHYRDLEIARSLDSEPEFLGIWRLLYETVNPKAADKSPQPLLAGAFLKAILEGTPYPQGLQNAVINRIRADQNINYARAAMLKAILNRKYRIYKQGTEISMALNTENKNPAYLLGRLFAVLEKTQQDALGKGINATIKDRFWGSASATPKVVFPQLLRLAQYHIAKSEYGKISDKQIEDIIADIHEFPTHLSLDEQGLFAIGYYHQRQHFYVKTQKENLQQ